jgi:hypothetical protein
MDHEGGMEEELVGQIFEAMMISASGEGFVPFSDTRCSIVAKQVKMQSLRHGYCKRAGRKRSGRAWVQKRVGRAPFSDTNPGNP